MSHGTSPASTGPAGAYFEGQVGAFYLLSLAARAEPRGLPGTTIDRIEFQRAAEGHPLDDVIVHAHDGQGKPAVLAIQVKRSMTFAPSDPVFRDVVSQIARAFAKPEFSKTRYELAVAVAKSSQKIDGPYQDVLTWARQLGDAATFIDRLNRPGSASDDMRGFVKTFTSHLREERIKDDDETVWLLLRRLQILTFDYTAQGSASEEHAKERLIRVLHLDDGSRSSELWSVLTELSIKIASSGGDRTHQDLLQELQQKSFRFAGARNYLSARKVLAEASENALADIGNRVGGAMLTRHERVSQVRSALDGGRYIEIRGDAGVGKSGVLKHFAEQVSGESQVIVLSPRRTVRRGWVEMRAVIGFDGSARELLSDLASDGSAILFVDNLDFYDDEERLTVIDLLRAATKVPGMSVVVTARRDFGMSEPSWLPTDVINQLGSAQPVIIDDLSASEAEELSNAAPQLKALLADNHPARRIVARNLFRLSRLASLPSDAPAVRTEAEMAQQWWDSADGLKDQSHLDRARVLRGLAEQVVARTAYLDVGAFPSTAIDALLKSQTLSNLGTDRVAFRHDVLQEWAIANLLHSDLAFVKKLPLSRPAPAGLARGVELAARMAIERAADSVGWTSFMDAISNHGHHPSWRRAALLALVRSEIGEQLLDKASGYLLQNKGEILRELIRLVGAVDVEPGTKRLSALGLDPKLIPAQMSVPSGPSWTRLIRWLLSVGELLPAAAIPDVVDLYSTWSNGTLGLDPLTPFLVPWLYRWLIEIEGGSNSSFQGELTRHQINALARDLKTSFLILSKHAPELAQQYLQWLSTDNYRNDELREILKFRGTLAQAAPKELAEITAQLLVPNKDEEDESQAGPFREPFGYHDLDFIPASPSQGPFLELLVHAPEHGLKLVRQLIDHAVAFYSRGRDFGSNSIEIPSADGSERVFPWIQSYNWSRDVGSGPTIATCVLMALEAWAHRRIEAGESFDKVLTDILDSPNAPASYLLVVVDLLLSHWPKSRIAAIPFLACPELLCLDRERMVHDNLELPDLFGLKALQKEPLGLANLASLKARPSRGLMLDQLLGYYALDQSVENRDTLSGLLKEAAARLGPPKGESTLRDPEFMVVHALNLIDPKNYQLKTMQTEDGSAGAWEYVSPASETKHLQALQDESWKERQADSAMEARIRVALNQPSRSSKVFAAQALEWAQKVPTLPKNHDEDNDYRNRAREETILTAAVIAVRDGGAEVIAAHETWIRNTFLHALKGSNDPVHRVRSGLQFNPVAIAFVGMVLLLRNRWDIEDVHTVLENAADENPAGAQGFAATAALLAEIDERLPRAILRCAFAACVKPHRTWRKPETDAQFATRGETHRQGLAQAIDAELAWLSDKRDEPPWPAFFRSEVIPRHRFGPRQHEAVEAPEPEMYTDHQAGALWLGGATSIFSVARRPWLRDVIAAYHSWTSIANGSELEGDQEADRRPREWNDVFLKLLAYCLPGLTSTQVEEFALAPIKKLPEEAFFDATTTFLRDVDTVYFNHRAMDHVQAVQIRSELVRRLMGTRMWERYVRERSTSTEIHFGAATAVVLFNDYGYFQPPKCYLNPAGIESADPFLQLIKQVAEEGQFFLVVIALLNLLEVAPRAAHLPVIVAAGMSWLKVHPDDKEFWVDQDVGRRLCCLLESILASDKVRSDVDQPLWEDIRNLLTSLVRIGVPQAHRLEERLP